MIQKQIKLLAASGQSNLSINEMRIVVAIERAIARIEFDSNLAKHFIFKGGFVLYKCFNIPRFTRDIDILSKNMEIEEVKKILPISLAKELNDHLWFGDIKNRSIINRNDKGGIRFDCAFQIDDRPRDLSKIQKLSRINIDVSFEDYVPSKLSSKKMKSLLPQVEPISWRVYPAEFIFSEKLQTIVSRGVANSRAKDVYDLIHLYPKCDKNKLTFAITNTFNTRNTDLPSTFTKALHKMDTSIMKLSWNSIQQSPLEKVEFDTAWRKLIKIAKDIDGFTI